jgi:urea transporter
MTERAPEAAPDPIRGDGAVHGLLARWECLCAEAPILRFVDANLRGVGQVMFQDNPLSGLLFLAAIAWGAIVAGDAPVFIAGVLGVVVATATAMWLAVDEAAVKAGLYGYNGALVGLALATFLASGPALWAYVTLGAAVSTVAALGTAGALKPLGAPALTFPFVVVTWILLLASYGFAGLSGAALPVAGIVAPFEPAATLAAGPVAFAEAVLLSISQVFLKASVVSALLLIAGLAVSSVPAALFALGGAILAVAVAHGFGAESDLVSQGLLGFSPVLTAIALGVTFRRPGVEAALYAALGVVFTVVAQAALDVALRPFAIPALTAPFILVSWMFLLSGERRRPGSNTE